jgi:hypothetical protein
MDDIPFDPGPPDPFARHFATVPAPPSPDRFWFDWGTVFYRGRLDGTARLLCIASDPGPTERIANRVLVGDAGQRVQGFLAKLGLTRSYVCLNAFAWALFPSETETAPQMLADSAQLAWRNHLYDMVRPGVQAVVAFGAVARAALSLWPGRAGLPTREVAHPSSHDPVALTNQWRDAVTALRGVVTPDPDGDPTIPNYGTVFSEEDYRAIPRIDLPWGVPAFLGDDAWNRAAQGRSSVGRPSPDDRHTLIWHAPMNLPNR